MQTGGTRSLFSLESSLLQAPAAKHEPRENEKRWQTVKEVDQKIHTSITKQSVLSVAPRLAL